MYTALQFLIGLIALALLFFLAKTLWIFSIRLKEKYYLLGLIWQGIWIIIGLGVLFLSFFAVQDSRESRKRQERQEQIKEECKTTPEATPEEIRAEYQRQLNRGYRPIHAVYGMAKQENRIGHDIFCLMRVEGVTATELVELLEQE